MGEYFLEHARRLGLVLPAAQGPGAPRGRMAKAAKKWLGAVCPPESKRRDILKLAYMASYYHRH